MSLVRRIGLGVSIAIMQCAHASRFVVSSFFWGGDIRGVRVIVRRENQVLLVRHWYAPWMWTLPGGGINTGETPQQAAIRETREETGLEIQSFDDMMTEHNGRLGKRDITYVVSTSAFTGTLCAKPDIEIMSRQWFDMRYLPENILPSNRNALMK